MLVQKYIEQKLRAKSESTIKTYKHAIEQFESWLTEAGTNLQEYSRADVQQYLDGLTANGKSAATVNKVYNAIKSFSRWAGKKEAIEEIRVVKQPDFKNSAPKSLPRLERLRLIRESDRKNNKRDFAIITTLLNTGVRVSELVSLNRNDVEISERKGNLTVRQGKGNKERVVPLNPETRRAIQKSLDERTDDHPALFISNRLKRISIRNVQHILEKYGIHPHLLRHTFITDLVRNNDLVLAQFLSGHSSTDMLARYSKPTMDDMQEAVDELYIEKHDR
ncbi:tyrosine-type recombinase/integrase [Heyndrickxia sporothermodurans]|uniref:tyrosine-type recombinase/integrase n=1 Tax=Heyndrickxia sporothermodurans TaxID=46224 RepID=UPI000D33ED18|nr:tyrosine-type recombinase/integrase [Heyndrickxia sporothermodurans]PTY93068.1 integrase [Heyndrickxia sporothermodurans]